MPSVNIVENIYWVGAKDPGLRVFDLYVKTTYGTTYNSYLVKGEKTALIDGVKNGFESQLFSSLNEIMSIDKIDYLIVNHNEPDHSGCIVELLRQNPNIELICSKAAVPFLRNVINDESRAIAGVKTGDKLDLGSISLEFISAPFMHWPDTMFCYCPEQKVLFPCDAYGAHLCPTDSIFAKPGDPILEHEAWYYYDSIMRPFAPFSRKSTQEILNKEISIVAPSHGPIVRDNAKHSISKYLDWTEPKFKSDKKLVTIFVASSYGNTFEMAKAIAASLENENIQVRIEDACTVSVDLARDLLESSDGLLFGTPTFAGDAVKPIWDVAHLLPTVSITGKKAAAFGSYGWGGQATEILESYLEQLKLKVLKPGSKARLVPSQAELAACREFGKSFAGFLVESKPATASAG